MYSVAFFNYVLLILATQQLLQAKVIFMTDHPVVQIGARFYKKELLTSLYSDAKELAYDPISRNLYFMYMDPIIQNSGRAFLNIDTKAHRKIDGIELNKATAVDDSNGEVYFGSENGLYKYDRENNMAVNIGLYNVNVMKLVIRRGQIYLIDANDHSLYRVTDNGTGTLKVGDWKTVMQFDVDYDGNYHFVTMCGAFCAKNRQEVNKIDIDVVQHYIVREDYVLGINVDTIYRIYCNNGTAERIGQLGFTPSSVVLGDDGDILYSVDDEIYLLRPITYYYLFTIRSKSRSKERQ